jgi:hypothetical protein
MAFTFLFAITQVVPTPKPGPLPPNSAPVGSKRFFGDVIVPASKTVHNKIVWKRIVRSLPKGQFDPQRTVVWISNETHPGPTTTRNGEKDWLKYDPRKVQVTKNSISFYAPAGNHIFFSVGLR